MLYFSQVVYIPLEKSGRISRIPYKFKKFIKHKANEFHKIVVDVNEAYTSKTVSWIGKVHDKRLLEESEIVQYIPDEVVIEGDLGFQGLQKEFVN